MKNPLEPPYNIDLNAVFRAVEQILSIEKAACEILVKDLSIFLSSTSILKMELQKWKEYQSGEYEPGKKEYTGTLLFNDWQAGYNHPKSKFHESIYQTEIGNELSNGDFHHTTGFPCRVVLDLDHIADLRLAKAYNAVPVFELQLDDEEQWKEVETNHET